MCTDYDIRYACGHMCHSSRADPDNGKLAPEVVKGIYADCTVFPTARVFAHCPRFKETNKICPAQDRLVITERWDIVCSDNPDCRPIEKYDDDGCAFLEKSLETDRRRGQAFIASLTEKEKTEMLKASTRMSQPPVWGRKGPHVKKPRKVKSKEEREREKEEKARIKAQKEAEKALRDIEKANKKALSAARALTTLANGKSKGGRKKNSAKIAEDSGQTAVKEKFVGRKRKPGGTLVEEVVEVSVDITQQSINESQKEEEASQKARTKKRKREKKRASKVEPGTVLTYISAKAKKRKVCEDTDDDSTGAGPGSKQAGAKPAPKRQRKERPA